MNISVIIPCYKQEHYLARCLASVMPQLLPNDEVIVFMDDAKNQHYPETIYSLAKAFDAYMVAGNGVNQQLSVNLRRMASEDRKGVSFARNRAVEKAVNPWVKFLDCDDLLAPGALKALRVSADKVSPEVQVIAGTLLHLHNGLVLRPSQMAQWSQMTRINPCLVSQAFVRRSALEALQGFDERIHFEEDWDLWLRMARKFPNCFASMIHPVCFYWIDDDERKAKVRDHTVEGMDVREYFAKTYRITPDR